MDPLEHEEREAARERQSYVRHELRAPLAVMYPLISLLAEELAGPLTDDQRRYMAVLQRSAECLEARIAGATESGWLECAAVPPKAEFVPLDSLILDHLRILSLRASEGPAVDATELAEPSPIAVCDRGHLHAAFTTLMRLARASTGAGGTVRVATGRAADRRTVTLSVEDGGEGMSPADMAQARTFGHEPAAADAAVGLDIELWVVGELMTRNGGTMDMTAGVGRGTRVTLSLPDADAEPRPPICD